MANITFKQKGSFKHINGRLEAWLEKKHFGRLDKYGKMGVEALKAATPVDTGKTADSWSYEIVRTKNSVKIVWSNSNTTVDGIPIVVLLQYGHATGYGTYVQGRDFINPAIQPVFDKIAAKVWKEVTS